VDVGSFHTLLFGVVYVACGRQRVDVCTEIRQLVSDEETSLSRVIVGDLAPSDFFRFPKMKLKLKGCRKDTVEEIRAESQRVLDTLTEKDFQEAFQKREEKVRPVSTCGRELLRG
jgi:hypothetical protein